MRKLAAAIFRAVEAVISGIEWIRWGYSWYRPYSKACDIVCREVLRDIPDQIQIRSFRLLMRFGSYLFSIDFKGEIGAVLLQQYLDPHLVNSDNWLNSDTRDLTDFGHVRPSLAVINKTQRWANLVKKGRAKDALKERKDRKKKERESALALVAEIKMMRRSDALKDAVDGRSGVII